MLGINGGEALVLLLVAVIVVGPERLPHYAEQLGVLVRRLRLFLQDARTRVDEELGVDTSDVDWQALDPRRYDPRRIVREALLDEIVPPAGVPRSASAPTTSGRSYTSGARAAAAATVPVPGTPSSPATGAEDAPGASTGAVAPEAVPYDDEAT